MRVAWRIAADGFVTSIPRRYATHALGPEAQMIGLARPVRVIGLALLLSASSMMALAAGPTAKKPASHAVSEQVKQAQIELNRGGANIRVDGVSGAQTRNALMKFQAAHGLKKTGRLDVATRKALGIA